MQKLRSLIGMMLEAESTAPIAGGITFSDPKRIRREKMDQIAREVADVMDLASLKFLASSTRILGAYAYAAIDSDFNNVVVKIQPAEELEGYKQSQMIISNLPDHVARHLPRIYKVRTLEEIGVKPPVDDMGRNEQLGVVVMERLEELPGNMFDLITKPATRSMHSLESLVRDREAFSELIDESMSRHQKSIESAVLSAPQKTDPFVETERLRNMLVSVSYNPKIVKQDKGVMLSTVDGLRDAVTEKIRLWYLGLGITRLGTIQSLSQMIMSTMISILGRRAIPKEPTKEIAGPLGKIRGVRELVRALNYMKMMNINPSDVHGNNIMVRPDTGELVISDLGHF